MNCKNCGKEIGLNRWGRQKKYCNQKCNSEHQWKMEKEKKENKKLPKNNKCKYCGSPCVGDYCSILHNSYDKGALVIEGKEIVFREKKE